MELVLKETTYLMDIKIDFDKEKLTGECKLTFINNSHKAIAKVPILIYRLMKVTSLKDTNNNSLKFTQNIVSMEDREKYHVNFIEIELPDMLAPKSFYTLLINYEGYLAGYTETGMDYIRDKIDPEFTILRSDCLAYPIFGYPCEKVNRRAGFAPSFSYEINITVPDSLSVANGGNLKKLKREQGYVTYTYENIKPAWRIDITIGKYRISETGHIKLYYFEKDSAGAKIVDRFARNAVNLYTSWWGELKEKNILSVIEIPSGFGSQADVTAILQTADAFNDSTQMRQLYHELSHLWNVTSNDTNYSRWNEGLATFIEYLTIEKIEKRLYLDYVTKWYLQYLKRELKENSKLFNTSFNDFGKVELTDYSYSTGMIMFYALYEVMGEENFNKLIRTYYHKYHSAGATTEEFIAIGIEISGATISDFFNDWFYTNRYTDYLLNGLSIEEIALLYRKE